MTYLMRGRRFFSSVGTETTGGVQPTSISYVPPPIPPQPMSTIEEEASTFDLEALVKVIVEPVKPARRSSLKTPSSIGTHKDVMDETSSVYSTGENQQIFQTTRQGSLDITKRTSPIVDEVFFDLSPKSGSSGVQPVVAPHHRSVRWSLFEDETNAEHQVYRNY